MVWVGLDDNTPLGMSGTPGRAADLDVVHDAGARRPREPRPSTIAGRAGLRGNRSRQRRPRHARAARRSLTRSLPAAAPSRPSVCPLHGIDILIVYGGRAPAEEGSNCVRASVDREFWRCVLVAACNSAAGVSGQPVDVARVAGCQRAPAQARPAGQAQAAGRSAAPARRGPRQARQRRPPGAASGAARRRRRRSRCRPSLPEVRRARSTASRSAETSSRRAIEGRRGARRPHACRPTSATGLPRPARPAHPVPAAAERRPRSRGITVTTQEVDDRDRPRSRSSSRPRTSSSRS